MSDNSAIEWTDATWNPVTGCKEVSPGCDNCYAKTFAERWRGTPGHHFENGFDVTLRPERIGQPLKWRKPRRVFVNSMSDLFHEDIPNEFIARVFVTMARTPQHTYQILTKRHGRMRSLIGDEINGGHRLYEALTDEFEAQDLYDAPWPLPNVWLGVSAENQQWADIRVPALIQTAAAVRWVSAEPLLGPINIPHLVGALDWLVAGGESGPGARPMHPDWARSLRDQCSASGTSFFFKQYGAWVPESMLLHTNGAQAAFLDADGTFRQLHNGRPTKPPMARGEAITVRRVSKKAAGRELDGRTWDEFPNRHATGSTA